MNQYIMLNVSVYIRVTECIVCVPGHDPLIFSFLSFLLFDWVGVLWPQLFSVTTCVLGRQRPFSPCVPAEADCLFAVAAGVRVFISGESLYCFLVGVQIKVML